MINIEIIKIIKVQKNIIEVQEEEALFNTNNSRRNIHLLIFKVHGFLVQKFKGINNFLTKINNYFLKPFKPNSILFIRSPS